jgi:hypothetical protein
LNRLDQAFETAHTTHPSPEAKKIWSEARKAAAKKMDKLEDVAFMNHHTAFGFLEFLNALHREKHASEAYHDFQKAARVAARKAGSAQEIMIEFREDLRIVVGQITTIMSASEFLILRSSVPNLTPVRWQRHVVIHH